MSVKFNRERKRKNLSWGRPGRKEKKTRRGYEADKLASIDLREIQAHSYATMHPEINLSISMHAELEWGLLHHAAPQGPLSRAPTPSHPRRRYLGRQSGTKRFHHVGVQGGALHVSSPLAVRRVNSLEQATLHMFGSRALSLWFCHLR